MGRNLQFRRGLESQVADAHLLISEPGYSTDEKKLHIGSTVFLDEIGVESAISDFKEDCIRQLLPVTIGQEVYQNKVKLNSQPAYINLVKNELALEGIEADKLYRIGANQRHITMDSGFNIEESFLELLSVMGSSFVLNNKETIVHNGMKNTPLFGATIKGKTINCIYKDSNWVTKTNQGTSISSVVINDCMQLKPAESYLLYVEVEENTRDENYNIAFSCEEAIINSTCAIDAKATGVFKFIVTTKESLEGCSEALRSASISESGSGSIRFKRAIIAFADEALLDTFPEIGITSVQANVVHNNIKHLFYASEQDKVNKRVIELHSTLNAYDALIISKYGDGLLVQTNLKVVLNGNESEKWLIEGTNANGLINFKLSDLPRECGDNATCICSQYINDNTPIASANKEGIFIDNNSLYLRKFASSGIDTTLLLKSELRANPVTIVYQLKKPIVTIIHKTLMPCITTQETNAFWIDSTICPDAQIDIAINRYQQQLEEINALATDIRTLSELAVSL